MKTALLALVLAAAAAAPAAGRAQPYVVDQQCSPEFYGAYSIPLGTPLGQEFRPQYAAMNVAEVWVTNGTTFNSAPSDLYAVVHADSIHGPVLGTSGTVTVGVPYDGAVRFDFPVPMTLVPGALHVLEVRQAGGDGNPMMHMGDVEGACPGVVGVFQGHYFTISGGDFWYRTGADAELPARARSWGAVKALYR